MGQKINKNWENLTFCHRYPKKIKRKYCQKSEKYSYALNSQQKFYSTISTGKVSIKSNQSIVSLNYCSFFNNRAPSPSVFSNSKLKLSSNQNSINSNTPLINISETKSDQVINNDFTFTRTGSSSSRISNSSGSEQLSPLSMPFLTPPITTITPSNSTFYEERLDFDVTHFFMLGSSLGLVLASRRLSDDYCKYRVKCLKNQSPEPRKK